MKSLTAKEVLSIVGCKYYKYDEEKDKDRRSSKYRNN